MEQHPVPQQISSYQFRLVGDMTLKQFMELAAGALIGLLFYSTGLPALIKWPLIIISVLIGIALAFLPLEDRPLEVWIVAFFRSIYSPTMYFWQKSAQKEQYFQEETGQAPALNVIAPQGQAALKKYLQEKPDQRLPFFAKLEEAERGFLSKVSGLLGGLTPKLQVQTAVAPAPAPMPAMPQPTTLPSTTVEIRVPLSGTSAPSVTTVPTVAPITSTIQTQKPSEEPKTDNVLIPQTSFIKVSAPQTANPTQPQEAFHAGPIEAVSVNPTIIGNVSGTTQQVEFSVSASPPMPPSYPNTVSGQVMDSSGRIIEAAILEIKDASGRPMRAVKTNKVGHFFIVTPLASGTYEIVTEKDGYEFDPVKFTADGKIIPPIAIRSRGAKAQ